MDKVEDFCRIPVFRGPRVKRDLTRKDFINGLLSKRPPLLQGDGGYAEAVGGLTSHCCGKIQPQYLYEQAVASSD
jgi:hypothetical protein